MIGGRVPDVSKIKSRGGGLTRDQADAIRYRWLRDNGHLNKWWSLAGPSKLCANIDADIDEAMKEELNERN